MSEPETSEGFPFISTAGLKGKRFALSARERATAAARRAYEEWLDYCHERTKAGEPVQERWGYTIDRALEALADGGADVIKR